MVFRERAKNQTVRQNVILFLPHSCLVLACETPLPQRDSTTKVTHGHWAQKKGGFVHGLFWEGPVEDCLGVMKTQVQTYFPAF